MTARTRITADEPALRTMLGENSRPADSFSRTLRLARGPSVKAAPPGLTKRSSHPRSDRRVGSSASRVTRAAWSYGLLAQNGRRFIDALRPAAPPPPATGATFRWPRLLSKGTRCQIGVGPIPHGRLAAASTLLRSPVALTAIRMHSCPSSVGVQLKGPTTAEPPDKIEPDTVNCAVVIASQSSGQARPVDGRQW